MSTWHYKGGITNPFETETFNDIIINNNKYSYMLIHVISTMIYQGRKHMFKYVTLFTSINDNTFQNLKVRVTTSPIF